MGLGECQGKTLSRMSFCLGSTGYYNYLEVLGVACGSGIEALYVVEGAKTC